MTDDIPIHKIGSKIRSAVDTYYGSDRSSKVRRIICSAGLFKRLKECGELDRLAKDGIEVYASLEIKEGVYV